MHKSVKLTDAIWLLQLVISSPPIHALGDPSQALTGIRTQIQPIIILLMINFKFKFKSVYCISCKVFTITNSTIKQILSIGHSILLIILKSINFNLGCPLGLNNHTKLHPYFIVNFISTTCFGILPEMTICSPTYSIVYCVKCFNKN